MDAALEFFRIFQKMHTLKYLLKRSIFVRIGPIAVNQLPQIILQQQPTINQIIITSLQNNQSQKYPILLNYCKDQ
jgi:hypothetical protein